MTAFTYTKPTVGGSEDTWGTTLNANWDALGAFLGSLDSAELAVLDGITSTTAELNLLDGVTVTLADITSTAAELNLLDGVTATTAEINYLSGVTGAIQTQIDNIPQPPELTQVQVEDDTSTVFGQVSGERLGQALNASLDALATGATGAPRIALKALEPVSAGDIVRSSKTVSARTSASLSFATMQSGTIRAKGTAAGSTNWAIGRYRNGVNTSIGSGVATSFSFDVPVLPFDLVSIAWSDGGLNNYTLSICTDGGNLWCGNPSTTVGVTGNDV